MQKNINKSFSPDLEKISGEFPGYVDTNALDKAHEDYLQIKNIKGSIKARSIVFLIQTLSADIQSCSQIATILIQQDSDRKYTDRIIRIIDRLSDQQNRLTKLLINHHENNFNN
jgi:hypothetical protein